MAEARQTDDPSTLTPAEARAIAKEAYVYGFPIVDNYRILYSYFVDRADPEYKGPWNYLHHTARVYTPDDTTIQTPNSDTPYSMLGADLRTEPLVLSVPKIEDGRYYSLQCVDLYTHNFAYVGSRTTGSSSGNYLLAGPKWIGEKPKNVNGVFHCETDLALIVYRTQLRGSDDLDNVKRVQAGYDVEPLSEFVGKVGPPHAPEIRFPKPLSADKERESLEMFSELCFLLSFCPTHPTERELMTRFAKLGIGPGGSFDPRRLSPEIQHAIEGGVEDAWQDYEAMNRKLATGAQASGDFFGTRKHLKNNYLNRMAAAVHGIYGNSQEEAVYPVYYADSDGALLDGKGRYTLTLAPDAFPPVNAFWSLTMYELPARRLVANRLNRYLINSPMLPSLKRDADGGVTITVQHDSPGAELEPNWLPAPAGPFFAALRLYWPKSEAIDGRWKQPPLKRVG